MNSQDKWRQRFLELASLVATWSKDESSQVGAVIVDANNRIVSLGFNGAPRGVRDGFANRNQKLRRTLHAEDNALSFAHRDVTGCTIYITHPPCAQCAARLIQRGIAGVIYPWPTLEFIERWRTEVVEADAMFGEAGVVPIAWKN
jgi:dCMP deaminase